MNIRNHYPARELPPEVQADVIRIVSLWAEARSRFGTSGDFLFGEFSAADIMYAPVVSRFATYSITLPRFAAAYCQAIIAHPFVQDWIAAAQEESWVIEKFEQAAQ
jgi:glutathione S-transferase